MQNLVLEPKTDSVETTSCNWYMDGIYRTLASFFGTLDMKLSSYFFDEFWA